MGYSTTLTEEFQRYYVDRTSSVSEQRKSSKTCKQRKSSKTCWSVNLKSLSGYIWKGRQLNSKENSVHDNLEDLVHTTVLKEFNYRNWVAHSMATPVWPTWTHQYDLLMPLHVSNNGIEPQIIEDSTFECRKEDSVGAQPVLQILEACH